MTDRLITPEPAPLLVVSKSAWYPTLRREHTLAMLAAADGHRVVFSERPGDIRAALDPAQRANFLACLRHPQLHNTEVPGVTRLERSVLVPGHRRASAAAAANIALRAGLSRLIDERTCAHVYVPWEWPAISRLKLARRSFGVADDWHRLIPDGERRLARYYRQIAAEADSIVVANAELADQFPGREVTVIPNGVFDQYIGGEGSERVPKSMVYIGTLSERFDAELMFDALKLLPDWRLDLIGACQYAGLGDSPAKELERLLALGSRVHWHGQLPRDEALALADHASVALIPNRAEQSHGQDSMKLYDYAARGLPSVASQLPGGFTDLPPGTVLASDPAKFAQAVVAAAAQPPILDSARRQWARKHSWTTRWPAWSAAIFGD